MILMLLAAAIGTPQQDPRGTLLIDRDRIDRPRAPAPDAAAPSDNAKVTRVATEGTGRPIAGIRFTGSAAPEPVARAGEAFIGRAMTRKTLETLVKALSDAYGKSGVALYTVAVPAQSFADGVVEIRLTEATVANAAVKGAPGAYPTLRARMAPLVAENPLSRRTFERQFTLMRAIPGLTIEPALTDPRGTGALELVVTPKQKRRKLSAGFSNRGVELLGDGQFDVRGEFYGALRDGDQVTLAASAASDFERFRYASAAYAVPVAANGLTLSANAAYLETRPRRQNYTGRAKIAGVTLGWPVLRNFREAADVTLAVDGIDSDNAAFGNVISSERTRAARVAAGYGGTRGRTGLSLSGSLSRGLDMLGARVIAPFAETGFTKGTLAAGVAQPLGKRGALRLNASAQYSRDRLPGAERYAIGGEAIGRGFDTSLLTGDRGAGAIAEVAWRPLKTAKLANSEVYGFVDGGVVGITARGAIPKTDYGLASTGVGTRLRYAQRAELGLEAARVIDDPFPGYRGDWRFSLSWRLSSS